jgi:hypothetical protein
VKKSVGFVVALLALTSAGASSGAESGLIGQWHLDEGAGSKIADSSGNGNNGSMVGAVQWVPGRFGTALSFGPATGRVQVFDNAALEPASAVSVSAWFRNQGSPGDFRYIVAKGATGCISASYGLYTGPDGGLMFYVSKGRGTAYTRSPDAGAGVWDGQWHMAVGTYDGNSVALFIDGHEVGAASAHTGPIEYLLPDSNDLFIGDYPGCLLHNFEGTIDDVNIWNRALSPGEVLAAFNRPAAVPTPPNPPGAPPGPTGIPGGGQPGHTAGPPAVGLLKLWPSAFAIDLGGRNHSAKRTFGTTITYTDTRAGRLRLSVLRRQSGVTVRRRCVSPSAGRRNKRAPRCFRYTLVGSFTHVDVAGRNSFHFSGIPGHTLGPGQYRLDVTPTANGQVGRTVSASFTIVA